MVRKDTLLIDASASMKIIKDRLTILFHDDVFPDLIYELAMDAWTVKFICDDSDEVLMKIVKDKINRFLKKEESEKHEIFLMIVSCIKDILSDVGMTIYTAIPKGASYVQYVSMNSFNHIHVKIYYDDFDEVDNGYEKAAMEYESGGY